jgi:hypothetical protein
MSLTREEDIGWAYLTVSLLSLLLGRRREWLMGALAILILLHLAVHHGGLFARLDHKPWLGPALPALRLLASGVDAVGDYVGLGDAVGSLAAIAMAGCLLGSILLPAPDRHRAGFPERILEYTAGLQGLARTVGGRRWFARHGALCLRRHGPARSPRVAHPPLIRIGGTRGMCCPSAGNP